MVIRLLATLLALLLSALVSAAEDLPGVRLWVDVDHGDRPIYAQEMVLLRVRGRFEVPVTLERMETPKLPGFRAVQIGRDLWSKVFEDGHEITAFQRTVAVFPQRSGRLVVEPFVHHLTVLNAELKTVKADVTTPPVSLDVLPPAVPASEWWLPAIDLRVAESWSVDPARLATGQSTRRTITIEADGVLDDQLPPPPEMRVPGLVVFPGNVTRSTTVGLGGRNTDGSELALRERSLRRPGRLKEVTSAYEGPVSKVTYTFDVRPASATPVAIPEIRIPWFQTLTGRLAVGVLPGRLVALAPVGPDTARLERELGIQPEPSAAPSRLPVLAAAGAGTIAFLATLALLLIALAPEALPALRRRISSAECRRAAWTALGEAARRRDAAALRAAVVHLARLEGDGFLRAESTAVALAALDRHLFAIPPGPPPDFADALRLLRRARRQARRTARGTRPQALKTPSSI